MALSLMLRNVQKVQGYSCLLRSTPVAFKSTTSISLPQLVSRTSSSIAKRTPVLLTKKILTNPSIRCMSGGDHRLKWTIERIVALSLIGLLPLTVVAPNKLLDNLTAIVVTLHLHWGIEAMAEDYVRPIIFGKVIPKVAIVAVYAVSVITLGGLLYFNYTDIGVGSFVRKLWAIKPV